MPTKPTYYRVVDGERIKRDVKDIPKPVIKCLKEAELVDGKRKYGKWEME